MNLLLYFDVFVGKSKLDSIYYKVGSLRPTYRIFIDIINETKADFEETSTDLKKMFLTK